MGATVQEVVKDEQVVVFRLEAERYGIDIFRVNEIVRLREITPLPHTQSHIRGLVNLRGKTIPVLDLGLRLGREVARSTDRTRIVVVEGEGAQIGLLVDEVCEVSTLPGSTVEPPPALVGGGMDFVRGVARRDEHLIALLDLDRIIEA